VDKRVRTLRLLTRSENPAFEELCASFLREADALSACHFARALERDLTLKELTRLLGTLRDEALAETLVASARIWKRDRVLRPAAHAAADDDRRHFLGLLVTISDRDEVLRLLAERHPGKDAEKLLVDFATSLDLSDPDAAPTLDETTRLVLRRVLEGCSESRLLERLADDFDADDVRAAAPDLRALEGALRGSSLFGPLCPRPRRVEVLQASSV
jgi:hypothetical protein